MIGIVEKRARSGVYVKQRDSVHKVVNGTKIALFISAGELHKPNGIYTTVFLGIQRFAEEHKCSLSINYLQIADANNDSIAELRKDADGIILLAEYDSTVNDFSATTPVVGVCMHKSIGGKLSLIDIDPYQSANLTTEYFQKKGMNKVVMISTEDAPFSYKNREDVFEDCWINAGGIIERQLVSKNMKWDSDTAYFFATNSILQFCSGKSLKESGEILSERAIVLGIDGKNLINPNFHPAPTIALDWQLVGRYAMEECIYRINNPGSLPKRIYLPGNLVEDNKKLQKVLTELNKIKGLNYEKRNCD